MGTLSFVLLCAQFARLEAPLNATQARPPHELYDYLARELSHRCYTAEMRCKSGPTRGLRTLVEAQRTPTNSTARFRSVSASEAADSALSTSIGHGSSTSTPL